MRDAAYVHESRKKKKNVLVLLHCKAQTFVLGVESREKEIMKMK